MAELDNSHGYNRSKQIVYWNLKTLNNLHSLSQAIMYHPFPQLHSQKHRDWSSLFFYKNLYIKGKIIKDSFISRSLQYINNNTVLDRVSFYKQQIYQLSVIKHQFWTRVYHLPPTSKQGNESRRIVRRIVLQQRFFPYLLVVFFSTIINAISGVARMKFSSRMGTFFALFCMAEVVVRIKKSDQIFYSIPQLPCKQLQAERQMILQQSMIIDGKINSYDLPSKINQQLIQVALNQKNSQDKNQILQAMGYKVIKKADLL